MRNSKNVINNTSSILLEFALSMPLLLATVFVGLEFSRTLKTRETMIFISSDSSSAALRECSDIVNPTSCLNDIETRTNQYLNGQQGNYEVVISLYFFDIGSNSISQLAIAGINPITGFTPNGNISRYSSQYLVDNMSTLINANKQFLAITEVFAEHAYISPAINNVLSMTPFENLYESAVY